MNVFPTKILLATDGSEEAELATQTAVDIVDKTRSELHVVHVGEFLSTFFAHTEEEPIELQRDARRLLDEEAAKIQEAMKGRISDIHLRLGRADEQIIALAEELEVGLIVMGSRGWGGVRRALVGSVSDSVVRHAPCPVLVVRGEEEQKMGTFPAKILLATDGSEEAELALSMSVSLANSANNSELHLITVGGRSYPRYRVRHPELADETLRELEREARETLDEQVRKVEEAGGGVTEQHVAVGNPVEKILNQADEVGAELIVMGTRGWGGVRRALMGSVSDSVVRHAPCPVLIVRKEKRQTGLA